MTRDPKPENTTSGNLQLAPFSALSSVLSQGCVSCSLVPARARDSIQGIKMKENS